MKNKNVKNVSKLLVALLIISALLPIVYAADDTESFGISLAIDYTASGEPSTEYNDTESFGISLVIDYTASSPDTSANDTESFGMSLPIDYTGTVDIELSPSIWDVEGTPLTGTSASTTYEYFTVWNNGSSGNIKIAINDSTDWIYCTWDIYSTTTSYDYFTANYTTDGSTWANIASKSVGEPVTTMFSSFSGSDTFGIKLWIPTRLSTLNQQTIKLWVKGVVIT